MQAEGNEDGSGRRMPKNEMQSRGEGEQEAKQGWKTVVRGKQHASKSDQVGEKDWHTHQGLKGKPAGNDARSTSTYANRKTKTQTETKRPSRARPGDPDTGDGAMVFAQLRSYIRNKAPKEFVTHTVLRLKELAKERRFQDLLKKSNKQEATVQEKEKLREQWSDELSDGEQERYQGLISCWDCAKDHHIERLGGLLEASLHKNEIDQDELEIRLRQFTFINDPTTSKEKNKGQDTNTSFKDVVSGTDNKWPTATEGEKVYQKWYELCMRPAEPIRVLREMTDEEKQAIEMILNHQLEVPIPPRFLIQIMDARELAVFTDLFMAIEYPLVVTVTFKGKHTAMKWVGWGMFLGMRMLTLVDYETQREDAKTKNTLIKLDFYRFTIAVKRGTLTSSDLYWVLTHKLGLKVQALAHVETGGGNINDKQWRVNIKAAACPGELRRMSMMVVDDAFLTIYHHEVNTHWPCSQCGALEHSGRFCRTPPERIKVTQQNHSMQIDGKLPSKRGKGSRDYVSRERPVTIEQLLEQVSERKPRSYAKKEEQWRENGKDSSKENKRPTLPTEWEQARSTSGDSGESSRKEDVPQDREEEQNTMRAHEETEGEAPVQDNKQETLEASCDLDEGMEDAAMSEHENSETGPAYSCGYPSTTHDPQAKAHETHNAVQEETKEQTGHQGSDTRREGREPKQKSSSPKRQLSENWKLHGDNERDRTSKAAKKDLTNVADEFKVHKEECEAALAAAGKGVTKQAADTEKLNTGNHYQAVTYDPERYQTYTDQWKELTERRNIILIKYGGRALDAEPFDGDKTAKAATKELKSIRRADKDANAKGQESINENTRVDEGNTTQNFGEKEKQKEPSGSCHEWMDQDRATADVEVQKKQQIATITVGEASKSTTTAIRSAPTAHYPPSVTAPSAMKAPRNKEGIADQDAKIAHGSVQPPKETTDGRTN
ncbi:uncharacterized protein PITG_19622 [Phytophthora infestans T30-4]|uniref:Uncharacterized protein n=1 Tax=Phytophthora infestans (strain T30-4) TaxID=403677 RepID=D0P0G0_PHYIT|nr:uncharacterized protein PITG_19622 [Phytophthora infestans T30-4]EEY52922.1 conserved hypothetical protein [Phytophthora infestans T30-4]|eukprot:XP_002896189.1 conserved hypothetical protein [Phytophthora infestans T30-4]